MPRGKPTPWEGPCRNADDGREHDGDVTALGRWRGQCGRCRSAPKPKAPPVHDGLDGEVRETTRTLASRPRLSQTVKKLVPAAARLERACDEKRLAGVRLQSSLADFKAALADVSAVAQSLLNTTVVRAAREGVVDPVRRVEPDPEPDPAEPEPELEDDVGTVDAAPTPQEAA